MKNFLKRPLSIEEAVSKRKEFENSFTVLYDSDSSISLLNEMVLKYQIKKQDIHDANIVATMVANNIKEIFSFNSKDFSDYDEVNLFEIPSEIDEPNGES